MRRPWRGRALGAALLLAGGAAGLWLFREAGGEQRFALAALDSDEAAALCARAGYPLGDFWERAKAVGMGAALVREKPLSYFMERGDILRFTREEFEKWKAMGLISPGSSLRPDTLWAKSPELLAQAVASGLRQGLAVSTSSSGGYHLAEFSPGAAPGLPAGYDPEILKSLEGRGLALAAAVPASDQTPGRPARVRLLRFSRGVPAGDLLLPMRSIGVRAGLAQWLRAAHGGSRRLLLARLDTGAGIEPNFEALRGALRGLAQREVALSLPEPLEAGRQPGPWEGRLRGLAAWLLGILGPLLAARAGLLALKRARTAALARLPVASPVIQLAAGMAGAAAGAVLAGLAARVLSSPGSAESWAFWAMSGPMLIGLLTLYTIDLEEWRKNLGLPLSYGGCLKGLALSAGLVLLFFPRWVLAQAAGFSAGPGPLAAAFWWVPWRWREILIGFPCLLHAFFLVNWRLDCPDCESRQGSPLSDPRAWFLLGLLGPIGVITALGKGAVPAGLALRHTILALLMGSLFGGLSIAARLRLQRDEPRDGSKDLEPDGTIVPESQV